MNIIVKYTAQLKKETGLAKETVSVGEEDSLKSLLEKVSSVHGPAVGDMMFDDAGQFKESIMIVHNGNQVSIDDPVKFRDGDMVMLMSPIAGG